MINYPVNTSLKLITSALLGLAGPIGWAATVELAPSQDNTIFEEGDLSNGTGDDLIAGQTGTFNDPSFSDRRALIQFDLASIPSGSRIETVELILTVNKTVSPTYPFNLHQLTRSWGEGNSNAAGEKAGKGAPAQAGDATWNHAFFASDAWSTPGGDFINEPSASQSVAGFGDYAWSGPGMVADVQEWLNNSATNFGWILIGPQQKSAKRFSSRESDFSPPRLIVTYTEGNGFWAGYFIEPDGRSVFTDQFLGWIDIGDTPWVYVYDLNRYIYAPEENVSSTGGWVWIGQ